MFIFRLNRSKSFEKRSLFTIFVVESFWHNESRKVGRVIVIVRSPDSVVLDGVIIPDGQREVVPPGLGVPDQKGAVLVLPK